MFKNKQIINRIKQTLLAHEFKGGYILSLSTSPDVYILQLQLPPSKEIEDLKLILNNLKEELKAHDVKIQETSGKRVTILFGKRDLTNINYNKNLIHPNTLQIELPSSFGTNH
jgi:hypothetical protein